MEINKVPFSVYKEKKNQIHTPEEIKEAFDASNSMCFNIAAGYAKETTALFSMIWALNPEALIKKADLCVMSLEPTAYREQYLLINKSATKEIIDKTGNLLMESEMISSVYCFPGKKIAGIKNCYQVVRDSKKPMIVKKGNLLIDGENLLLTVRSMTHAEREAFDSQIQK